MVFPSFHFIECEIVVILIGAWGLFLNFFFFFFYRTWGRFYLFIFLIDRSVG